MKATASGSRARLWGFALGVTLCLVVLCVAQHIPGMVGLPASTATHGPDTPDVPPTAAASPEETAILPDAGVQPTAIPEATVPEEPITLTVVYDNNAFDARLRTAWGFACWIEIDGLSVLFDTGGDGPTLLGNLAALGLDPQEIDIVVLSHEHDDHTGGLQVLLDANDHLAVYMPRAFPESLKARVRERATLVEVDGSVQIAERVWSLGSMGTSPVEQSLVIQSSQGLIVVTGCAHPGIVGIVRAASEMGRIHMVLGGFHLRDKSAAEIETVITQLRDLGVERIAPCHCTGEQAMSMFATAFGADYIAMGAGKALSVAP